MQNKLIDLRKQIDSLDERLLQILAKRINIVREIGKYKKAQGVAPLDEKRWKKVLESKLILAKKKKLSTEFIKKLYNLIHDYSLEIEEKL